MNIATFNLQNAIAGDVYSNKQLKTRTENLQFLGESLHIIKFSTLVTFVILKSPIGGRGGGVRLAAGVNQRNETAMGVEPVIFRWRVFFGISE